MVLDDAGLDLDRLTMLLELRREGYQFDIIATTWEEHIELVGSLMPDARRIRVPLISRNEMDGLLRSLGVVNYYHRTEILDQAAGRPGWAVHLAAAAMEVPSVEVFSGRALVKHIGSYLHRLGPAATQSLSLLGVLAAIGPVDVDTEMARLDDFLGIGMLQRLALLREAAAVGLLDQRGQRLSVAPHALQPALFAHVFFDGSVPLSVMELLEVLADRRERILDSLIAAARASDRARDALELLVRNPLELADATGWHHEALGRFASIDEATAERALAATQSLAATDMRRQVVLQRVMQRFVHPAAVHGLLENAIGDERPEHPHPEHPMRLLGELGRQILPDGQTTFGARTLLLQAANAWLDADPACDRQKVWARLARHLLDPTVEGTTSIRPGRTPCTSREESRPSRISTRFARESGSRSGLALRPRAPMHWW